MAGMDPEGKVMVNVDAFDEDGRCGSVGVVIRDCVEGLISCSASILNS